MNNIRTDSACSQSGAWMIKFHWEKLLFVQSPTRRMKFHLWWMNVLKRMSPESGCTKTSTQNEKWKMAEGRFASVCSVKPTSVRSLMTSFEQHLKKNGYSASIINNLVLEITWKVLQSKQKQLKKQGKGNKPPGGGVLKEFLGGVVLLAHWSP